MLRVRYFSEYIPGIYLIADQFLIVTQEIDFNVKCFTCINWKASMIVTPFYCRENSAQRSEANFPKWHRKEIMEPGFASTETWLSQRGVSPTSCIPAYPTPMSCEGDGDITTLVINRVPPPPCEMFVHRSVVGWTMGVSGIQALSQWVYLTFLIETN